MNERNNFIPLKIILIGSINVGKTSLITKYSTGIYSTNTNTVNNPSYIVKIREVNGIKYEIKLWDTAVQEKYKSLSKLFFKNANIAILVYSIDNEESFNDLDEWLKLTRTVNNEDIILGVAANKIDLALDNTISEEKGREYAKRIGGIFYTTSALLENKGLDNLIDDLLRKYNENNNDYEYSNILNVGMIQSCYDSNILKIDQSREAKKGCLK